jgi:hypothetical protein
MPTGFIYVLTTVTKHYEQRRFCNVPTEWEDRLYFGPCKIPMRPRMQPGDFVFGISGSATNPRRIVFVGQIEERITFAEAHRRFPDLRGPYGPIHVSPLEVPRSALLFPRSSYEHIPGAMHSNSWEADLASRELDAFFVCSAPDSCVGRWLGASGPEIGGDILEFLKKCSVHGPRIPIGALNKHASVNKPVVYRGPKGGDLTTGLHAETNTPEDLLDLCTQFMSSNERHVDHRPTRLCCGTQASFAVSVNPRNGADNSIGLESGGVP